MRGNKNARGGRGRGRRSQSKAKKDPSVPRASAPEVLGDRTDRRGPYGVIRRRLWERPDFTALPFEARALAAYLLTCPMGGLLGVFRLHLADVEEHLGMREEAARRALAELERDGFVQVEGRWVWVVGAFAATPAVSMENLNHRSAVEKALQQIPPVMADAWRALYYSTGRPAADGIGDGMPDGMGNGISDGIGDQGEGNGDGAGDENDSALREKSPSSNNARTRTRARTAGARRGPPASAYPSRSAGPLLDEIHAQGEGSDCRRCGKDSCEGCSA